MRAFLILFLLFCLVCSKSFARHGNFPIDSSHSSLPYDSIEDEKSNNVYVIIDDIKLSGNRITKDFIILREITFKKGETIALPHLYKELERSREQIYNTTLFVDDSVYISSQKGNVVSIKIVVKERWYLFPLPYFKLADRNFNTWWTEENRSLDRINYGIKFMEMNLTGRNDKLDLWLINGYTQQLTARYQIPYLDKALTKGLNIGVSYATQHEINYATGTDNKQLFYKEGDIAETSFRTDLSFTYRPNQRFKHIFRVSYNKEEISDSIFLLNQNFFLNNSTTMEFSDFTYTLQYTNADYNAYPTKGLLYEISLNGKHINNNINTGMVSAHAIGAFHLLKNTFVLLEGSAAISFPPQNYYSGLNMFGYGNFQMHGYEYYVVDGVGGLLGKIAIHQRLFKYVLKNPAPSKTHDRVPFIFYLKVYSDYGYCYNPYDNTSVLNNQLMRSWGVGLDIVSIYDFVFKIEWSINQLGIYGAYLHTRNDF